MGNKGFLEKYGKFMVGAGALAAGIATYRAVSCFITKKLVSIALDRKKPKSTAKSRKWLTGSKVCEEMLATVEQAAARLAESDCETVEIVGRDGARLVGHWQSCEHPKRVIIAMHGWRSSWNKDFGLISEFWHDQDCSVLYAEQRGQNNSGGEYMSFGLMERYDCLEWIQWVQARMGEGIPIYLAGISMGASTVLMAGGLTLPPAVHGIMADCGYTSLHEIWKHVVTHNLHLSYKVRENMADDLCRKKIQVGTKDYSTVKAMQITRVPVLFIHGTADGFVPIEMTYENYTACVAPKRLLVVPGADHGMSYLIDRTAYEAATVAFWKDFDESKPDSYFKSTGHN